MSKDPLAGLRDILSEHSIEGADTLLDAVETQMNELEQLNSYRQNMLHRLANKIALTMRNQLNSIVGLSDLIVELDGIPEGAVNYGEKIITAAEVLLESCGLVEELFLLGLED